MYTRMTTWDDLPRDLHLRIIKYLDIDTRIKMGLIGRLRIPQSVENKLSATFDKISHGRTKYYVDGLESSSTEVLLGSRNRFVWAPNCMDPIYVVCFTPPVKGMIKYSWKVNHFTQDNKVHVHGWDPSNHKWALVCSV